MFRLNGIDMRRQIPHPVLPLSDDGGEGVELDLRLQLAHIGVIIHHLSLTLTSLYKGRPESTFRDGSECHHVLQWGYRYNYLFFMQIFIDGDRASPVEG
jgi:hypothetical protein